jgi:hypothetical protein
VLYGMFLVVSRTISEVLLAERWCVGYWGFFLFYYFFFLIKKLFCVCAGTAPWSWLGATFGLCGAYDIVFCCAQVMLLLLDILALGMCYVLNVLRG